MSVALEQFRRVNPYPGLMVDVDVWRDAHDYHRAQLHLHHLALHGWGIVQGLDITLVEGTNNTLAIEPGLAIDPAGNFISVPQGQTYQITARERQLVYLVLQQRELLSQPAPPTADNRASPMTRVIEAYRIQERDRLPEEPYIELARVDFHPDRGAIRAPADAESPKPNELDLRARVRLGTLAAPLLMAAPRTTASSDDLSGQLDSLTQRVASLANDVEHGPSQQEFKTLADEIRRLAAVDKSVAAQASGPPAERGEVSIDPELIASVVAGQILPVGARIDDLSRQLQALTHEVESAPAPAPTPPPISASPVPDRGIVQLAVAEHGAAGWDTHLDGLRYLAREVGAETEWRAGALDPVRPGGASAVDVLYISGTAALALGDADVDGISRVLEAGGVVIGEGCAAGPGGEAGAREFAMSFVDLATRLGRQLMRVERNHALMRARHVFGEAPPGGRTTTARVLESGGMVYSDADYGCAWQGGPASQALPRAAIRDALEFGTNLAVFRRNGT